jgi:hypothetical protein
VLHSLSGGEAATVNVGRPTTAARSASPDPDLLIHEPRPRRMSDEEMAERQAAAAAGMAKQDSWVAGTGGFAK